MLPLSTTTSTLYFGTNIPIGSCHNWSRCQIDGKKPIRMCLPWCHTSFVQAQLMASHKTFLKRGWIHYVPSYTSNNTCKYLTSSACALNAMNQGMTKCSHGNSDECELDLKDGVELITSCHNMQMYEAMAKLIVAVYFTKGVILTDVSLWSNVYQIEKK